jgi:PAS domain S-box-containing protein
MTELSVHPLKHRLLWLLTLAVALTLLTLGWLSWTAFCGYRFVTRQLPAISHMEEIRGQILLFDEVLTMSARMSSATGDPQWEARYRRFDPQLDQALQEAMRLAPAVASSQAAVQTDAANTKLVVMENRAFELVRQGQQAGAQQLLSSEEYDAQKKVYAAGMAEFNRLLKQTIDSVRAEQQVQVFWSVVPAAISAPLLMLGWWFVLRAVRRWQTALVNSNRQLKGQAAELEEFTHQLDEKVNERTKQLKESELATLNMMEDAVRSREKVGQAYEDLKRAAEALRESEEKFRSLFERSRDALMTLAPPSWAFTSCNQSTADMFRAKNAEEFMSYGPADLSPEQQPDGSSSAQKAKEMIEIALRDGSVFFEWRHKRIDGEEFPATVLLTRIEQDGKPSLQATVRDITEHKRAEEERAAMQIQIHQAQKLESIGRLAGGIAHEINTPTQYIGDNVRFLQDANQDITRLLKEHAQLLQAAKNGSLTPEMVTAVETAAEHIDVEYLMDEIPHAIAQSLEGVHRVSQIVGAMKEFSHPGTAEKTAINLNHAIESTTTVARSEWKYVSDLQLNLEPSLPLVPCLAGEFNQVILNLVINAAHAIAEKVGDGSQGKGAITVSTRRDGDWVEVRVADSGNGIPARVRDKIFTPFFTTKPLGKGTGQGLALARSVVVDKLEGTITFESEEGAGSTFIIRLPLEPAEAIADQADTNSQSPMTSHKKICLVVDDTHYSCDCSGG